MSNLKLNLILLPFTAFFLNVTSHPLVLTSAFSNQFDKLSENSNPNIPVKVNYHIGSRFDPFKESLNSPDDYHDLEINPVKRVPSVDVLLPWEDDPETVYLTEKPQNNTNNVTSTPTPTSTSTSTSSNLLDKSPSTLSSSTKLSFSNPITEPNTTVSLLPWEEDSWQLFETTENSNLTLITAPSTLKTPLIITMTNSSTSPSTTIGSTSSTSTASTSSSTVTVGTTTTYSPLPWEEDYFDNIASNPIQTTLGSTLKPYEPATSKLTTSPQEPATSSTTTRSTDLITISTNTELSIDESIFNLVPLKPIDNSDPNWPKFPNKRPKAVQNWL